MTRKVIEILPVGFNQDLPPDQVGADTWTGGVNVSARDGISQRIAGYENIFGAAGQPPIWLLPKLTPTIA